MKLAPVNYQFLSSRPAAVGFEARFTYRAGKAYKPRSKFYWKIRRWLGLDVLPVFQ